MPTRRRFLDVVGRLAAVGSAVLAGCTGGSGGTTTPTSGSAADSGAGDDGSGVGTGSENGPLEFSIPAFADGGPIPERHTVEGADVSPRLVVESVPEGAETLALVVDDPDANGFVHWLLWNVPATVAEITEGIDQSGTVAALDGARQGTNDFGELGYRGPAPPADDGPHTYRFEMSAVGARLDLSAGAEASALRDALDGRRLATHRITGEFDR